MIRESLISNFSFSNHKNKDMIKKITQKFFLCLLLYSLAGSICFAQPTEVEILASIDLGVTWIASQQNPDGSWGVSEQVAYTGFALTKICDYAHENGYSPFEEDFPYHSQVTNGFNYIFGKVVTYGADKGLCATPAAPTLYYHHETYNAAMALMAVAVSRSPDRVITFPANPLVDGLTFLQLQNEMVQHFIWSQTTNLGGGWAYEPSYPDDDNSHSGYVTIALRYAETEGSVLPQTLKDNLSTFIDFIQNDVSGGSGYMDPTQWVNLLKTGNLLTEMALVGDVLGDTRVQAALNFIETNWSVTDIPSIYEWGIDDPQTMYCLMKGLESFDISTLSIGGPDDTDWFADFTAYLVSIQNPSGFWPDVSSNWDNTFLNTCWALFVLEKVVPNLPPVAICANLELSADENCEANATAEDIGGASYDPEEGEIILEISPEGPYPLGETSVTLTVTDDEGATSECTALITVIDDTPPTISATTEAFLLKQNNHKYETFGLEDFDIMISDNCSDLNMSDAKIVRVTSDEPEDIVDPLDDPDGSTLNDMVITDDCQSVMVRKERAGTGNGRVYTVELMVTDGSANSATTHVLILVPHNTFAEVIDDGPVYEVVGECNEKSGIITDNNQISYGFELSNFPNPFTTSTTIQFAVPVKTKVMLKVYNIFGQEIRTLTNQPYMSGTYRIQFETGDLPSGQYLYRLSTDNMNLTRKMIVNK